MDVRLVKQCVKYFVFVFTFFFTGHAAASYIEAAIGNAVVNDATSVYYNPSGLAFLANPQLIASWGETFNYSRFSGTTNQVLTSYRQTGSALSRQEYPFPSIYFATPVTDRVTVGVSGLYTFLGKEDNGTSSLLRYIGTSSAASLYDISPSFSVKLLDSLFVGAGADFSFAYISLDQMSGFPTAGIPDSLSQSSGYGRGTSGHIGAMWHPILGTILGIVYHSPASVTLDGHSTFSGPSSNPDTAVVYTNAFNVHIVAPPSVVVSLNQYVNPRWSFMGTVERMQWGTIRNLVLKNVAFKSGNTPVILPQVVQPFFLHNTWRFSLGTNYAITDKWAVRGAYSYDQDPGNPAWQVVSGNNIILSVGTTIKMSKQCKFDFSYGYTMYQERNINVTQRANQVFGTTSGGRNTVQGKIIVDFV